MLAWGNLPTRWVETYLWRWNDPSSFTNLLKQRFGLTGSYIWHRWGLCFARQLFINLCCVLFRCAILNNPCVQLWKALGWASMDVKYYYNIVSWRQTNYFALSEWVSGDAFRTKWNKPRSRSGRKTTRPSAWFLPDQPKSGSWLERMLQMDFHRIEN